MTDDIPPSNATEYETEYGILFLGDVSDIEAGYECQRCGQATVTKEEMWEHRKGLISRCERSRFWDWVHSLWSEDDDEQGGENA